MATAPKIAELLDSAKEEASSDWDRANLRVIERRWEKDYRIASRSSCRVLTGFLSLRAILASQP